MTVHTCYQRHRGWCIPACCSHWCNSRLEQSPAPLRRLVSDPNMSVEVNQLHLLFLSVKLSSLQFPSIPDRWHSLFPWPAWVIKLQGTCPWQWPEAPCTGPLRRLWWMVGPQDVCCMSKIHVAADSVQLFDFSFGAPVCLRTSTLNQLWI